MDRQIQIVLADPDEEYRVLFRRSIEGADMRLAGCAATGAEALALCRRTRPDVLVTEAALPDMDGFALLRRAKELAPGRMIVTAQCSTPVLLQAIWDGVRHFLPKPFTSEALQAMVRRAAGSDRERTLCEAMQTLGVPAHMKGYRYLCRAVELVMEDPSLVHALTKALYPAVAREFGVPPACVERSIRSAAEAAWLRGDPEQQRAFLGAEPEGRFSNGTLIAAVAERLRRSGAA